MEHRLPPLRITQLFLGLSYIVLPFFILIFPLIIFRDGLPIYVPIAAVASLYSYRRFVVSHEERQAVELDFVVSLAKLLSIFCLVVGIQFLIHIFSLWFNFHRLPPLQLDLQMSEPELQFLVKMLLSAFLVAPLIEELMFRALLLRYLLTKSRFILAVVAQAVLFAAMHFLWAAELSISRALQLTMNGVVLGLIYGRTGNLALVMFIHFGLNAGSFIAGMFQPLGMYTHPDKAIAAAPGLAEIFRQIEIVVMLIFTAIMLVKPNILSNWVATPIREVNN